MAEPILPEDSLIRLTLSNGDGLIGMTLMEHREHRAPTAVGALAKSDGFQVKEENHGLEGRWICMDLLVASLHCDDIMLQLFCAFRVQNYSATHLQRR